MKKQFIAASVATLTLAVAGFGGASLKAQSIAEGPIGEISQGSGSRGSGFADAATGQSPQVAFSSTGQEIEVFDPTVPTPSPEGSTGGANVADWITPDGRINLEGRRPTPEDALWAPANPAAGGWTDGAMGLQLGVDVLYFSRAISGGSPFAFTATGESFSNADISVDPESTVRYRLGVASEYGTGYEFVAYDFDEFSGTLALTGEGITPVFFGGIPAEPADAYSATYQSRIKNFELNVWARRSEALRVGYGLRHFSIEEEYDITLGADSNDADPTTGAVDGGTGFFSSTDNNLFGGQIMLELYREIAPDFYVVGGVKGLLLNNRVDIDADTENIDRSGEDSFITGGVNFNGGINYRVFRGFSLRAGYEGVFLGSVAAATTQSENNNLLEETISPFGESLYFGGGYFGCTVTF